MMKQTSRLLFAAAIAAVSFSSSAWSSSGTMSHFAIPVVEEGTEREMLAEQQKIFDELQWKAVQVASQVRNEQQVFEARARLAEYLTDNYGLLSSTNSKRLSSGNEWFSSRAHAFNPRFDLTVEQMREQQLGRIAELRKAHEGRVASLRRAIEQLKRVSTGG